MFVVPPTGSEIAACDPRRGAMAGGSEVAEAGLGGGKSRLRVVEAALLEQRPAEHELCVAGLVDVVDPSVEQLERVPSLLLRLLDVARPQMDLRERGDGATGVGVLTGLERDRERFLQQVDRVVGVPEEEIE